MVAANSIQASGAAAASRCIAAASTDLASSNSKDGRGARSLVNRQRRIAGRYPFRLRRLSFGAGPHRRQGRIPPGSRLRNSGIGIGHRLAAGRNRFLPGLPLREVERAAGRLPRRILGRSRRLQRQFGGAGSGFAAGGGDGQRQAEGEGGSHVGYGSPGLRL